VHHQLELSRGRGRELLLVEYALEQHGGLMDAGLAQNQAFIDPRNGEGVRGVECPRHRDEPMSIGIGLDDGHDARLRRPSPHHAQIVAERAGIDRRTDHRGHGNLSNIRSA
jgi:hypothetical protein